jgi:hypothetical protein
MLNFQDAVAKLAGKPPKPKSRFATMSPEEQRTRLNQGRGPSKPNASKTKPRAAGDPEPPEHSDPYSELEAQAKALRAKDPTLSESGAFTKVYLDPRNTDLVKREHAQRMAKIARAGR